MNLRVEYYYDPESRNWGFRVPSLHVLGNAATRPDVEQQAIKAIEFTLESIKLDHVERDCVANDPDDGDVEGTYVQVRLTPIRNAVSIADARGS